MQNLREWAKDYFQFRAQFLKFKLAEKNDSLELDYAGRKEIVYWHESLSIAKAKKGYMVTKNTTANIDFLSKNWENFLIEDLKIIFVNDDGTKWIINPFVHNKVCGSENLKISLLSLSGYGEE
jgi:hypothetical protein